MCCKGGAPGWYKDAFGIIHLQGAVTQTVSGGSPLITTLPAAARPKREVFTIVHTFAGTFADLAIAPNGQVGLIGARPPETTDPQFVSLEGVTYQPATKLATSPIQTEKDWLEHWQPPFKSLGASDPARYEDGSGIVHLEGATTQANGSGIVPITRSTTQPDAQIGTLPSLIGAVPPAAAPAHLVLAIVHTAFGAHAELTVTTAGQIFLTRPPAPAVSDFSFVSLEGVSYHPGALFNQIANVNSGNWSPVSGSAPGWVEDDAGIVHLQGSVNQTSASGPGANLIATLPRIIAPSRTVYTVVPADRGSYADVAIASDGGIRVLGPPPAAGSGFRDLSLDSITYQPSDAAGPRALSLTQTGDVLALLHKPRTLELAVFKLGPYTHLLGTVRLGQAPAGRSRLRWGLRLDGHRLNAGTYTAELLALPARGAASAGGPGVTFALTGKGRLRVLSGTCSVTEALNHRC